MLEISLSAVAAFAAYTCYAILKDDLAAQKTALKKADSGKAATPAITKPARAPRGQADKVQKPPVQRPRRSKAPSANDQVALASEAILAYLADQGPASLKKLSQTLKIDSATIQAASDDLVAKQAAVATKKGGFPGLAPA